MNAKKEKLVIPTYAPRKPIELPMFFERKPYQGASGRLYPIPFSDSISDDKRDVEYDVYTLENEYIKTQILPEFGGKILRAYDKIGDYDFVYYNEVVKPALVGLAGPWISGGIEFNYPQHHRPTTYMPLEAKIESSEEEVTVWTGEVEPHNRLKGMAGISIRKGRSYIKAKIKVYNRTDRQQLFMWWANLAVPANNSYKTIFPPDVEWVNDHDRRCVMSWPIAKGVYRTARPFDYGDGTDISYYSNIKVPSSFLVSQGQSDMDFVAGYDYSRAQGIVTVADHHIAPGKKLWHWGTGEFGDMWCNNLTDKNGPYIELMTGVYTDNQPDFCWIAPGECRTFEQYWYPIRDIGDVKCATADAALNVEVRGEKLFFGFNVTASFFGARAVVMHGDEVVFDQCADISPDAAYTKEIPMGQMNINDITVKLLSSDGCELVSYKTYLKGQKQPITPRLPAARPCEIENNEELYINGLHLEQYKQHNYDAEDYYLEGIRRDKNDIRCNTGMARISYKNGQFNAAVEYADAAICRMQSRNMHPLDTEALYIRGTALKKLGRLKEAYDTLGMAAWDYRYMSAANYEMATLDCRLCNFDAALSKLDISLSFNRHHSKASVLKAVILRKQGELDKARIILGEAADFDVLDMYCAVELLHFGGSADTIRDMYREKPEAYMDVAYDYIDAGFYKDAVELLRLSGLEYPMFEYIIAYCESMMGDDALAISHLALAEGMDTGYCFPSRLEDIAILQYAIDTVGGANAYYYLGCLYYDKFAYDQAILLWERCIAKDPKHNKAFRNLALAYFDKRKDLISAKICMEIALKNKNDDPRLVFEYQQMLKNMNCTPEHRIAVYEKYRHLALMRDDCYLDLITLHCLTGNYEKAIEMAKSRHFHIYEGGEGKLTKLHAWLYVLYGNQLKKQARFDEAKKAYEEGLIIPKSYGEAKTFFNQEAHVFYYLGLLNKNIEDFENAALNKSTVSEISVFRALALRRLSKFSDADAVLEEMLALADEKIQNCDLRTYYGVGSPSPMPCELDIKKVNLTDGYILKAYALLGLGKRAQADEYIKKAEVLDTYDLRIIAYYKISDDIMA